MSREAANITSFLALEKFRAQLIEYHELVKAALSEADSHVDRIHVWLQTEQLSRWETQVRKRQEEVAICKSALFRKENTPAVDGSKPSVVDEKKLLKKANRRLEEAQHRVTAVKYWMNQLVREKISYKGHVQPLSNAAEWDIPYSIEMLKKMILALEKYKNTRPPQMQKIYTELQEEIPLEDDKARGSMRRKGIQQEDPEKTQEEDQEDQP